MISSKIDLRFIIISFLSLYAIIVALWFFSNYGFLSGSMCFLCFTNIILIYYGCIQTHKSQLKRFQLIKHSSKDIKAKLTTYQHEFDLNLNEIDRGIQKLVQTSTKTVN
jgi:hypothetical protein